MSRRYPKGRAHARRERRLLWANMLLVTLFAGALGSLIWGACQPHGAVARVLVALLS